jgi:DNA-binding FrmR family transcriptional regulator
MQIRKIVLNQTETDQILISLKKIIGQLNSIYNNIEQGNVNSQTFTQLLAVKGGASRVCKEIIGLGVLPVLDKYSKEEINQALDIIFKL